jgi:hypothetical protein
MCRGDVNHSQLHCSARIPLPVPSLGENTQNIQIVQQSGQTIERENESEECYRGVEQRAVCILIALAMTYISGPFPLSNARVAVRLFPRNK